MPISSGRSGHLATKVPLLNGRIVSLVTIACLRDARAGRHRRAVPRSDACRHEHRWTSIRPRHSDDSRVGFGADASSRHHMKWLPGAFSSVSDLV
jgi:hypothetical protein